jgi:tetratricopeptide (TPR) repeat protein
VKVENQPNSTKIVDLISSKLAFQSFMKVFSVLFAALLCLSVITSFSQNKKAAEVYRDYKSRASTTVDRDLLEEANALKQTNPPKALDKVQEALGISIAQKDLMSEVKCYLLIAEINEGIQEWKLALHNYTNAVEKLSPKSESTAEYKTALLGLARTNLKLGNFAEALTLSQRGLNLRLSSVERKQFILSVSECHYQMGNYQEALVALNDIDSDRSKQLKRKEDSDDGPGRDVDVQNQKAKIFARMNEVDKAKNALQSSQNTIRSNSGAVPQQQQQGLKDAKEEVAEALHEQKRYDEEIEVRNESIDLNLDNNNLPAITADKVGLSKAHAAKGETSEAIRELEEAVLLADTIDNPKDQANAYLSLADLYDKNGRSSEALNTYKKYSKAVKKAEEQAQTKLTEKSELIEKQKEIETLKQDLHVGSAESAVEEATVFRQQLIIYGLLLIIMIIVVTSYFIYKNAQASKVANQLLALKSLRSQMNPHFIFNALNSVNHFVAQNDERTVNKFLSEFSRLMRLVMENSQEDFIPLYKEQEIISLYLKLEHYRFRDKFDYEIKIDDDINLETFEIPPMLLQPYIENAVWHGLRYKEAKGYLALNIRKNSNGLEVEINDNGIGRRRSAELKTENQKKHHSTGIKNIEERLRIINKVYKSHYGVKIRDLDPASGQGTQVLISIPEHKNGKS